MKDHGRYNTISNAMEFLDFLGKEPHKFEISYISKRFKICERTARRWLSIVESREWVGRVEPTCLSSRPLFYSKIRLEAR